MNNALEILARLQTRKTGYELIQEELYRTHKPASAQDYINAFNLNKELNQLPKGGKKTVLDIGCGINPQKRLKDLSITYPHRTFVGIDFNTETKRFSPDYPVIEGYAEALNWTVKEEMEKMSLWPPQEILMHNVLSGAHRVDLNRGQKDVLQAACDALPTGGRILIYEHSQPLWYLEIMRKINEMKLTGFKTDLCPVFERTDPEDYYIRIYKDFD